ncbi:branched-chain amino acid ABC transporter permease [Acidisoma cellulosilytica]|uniref:Branched-chain amino acid ABC transporter permease n=1 Tax=Acidisoma cellulosilyticum TaxID=2802395 RepID=A0A964E434_9PROT|nr:branched-chain amino acid ABC transporter permease [Acidisoma cellulosilyticum]MCB8881280.1 branched-chain amino acid ABC transporter permease [Acidisoma cellulosilyticum]
MFIRTALRGLITPLLLILGVAVITFLGVLGGDQVQTSLTEMLIRMVVVVGMWIFVGNSGVISFGHVGFMCIGGYAAAWATVDPNWKSIMLTGLPDFLQNGQYPFPYAVIGGAVLAAVVAIVLGAAIMRLSGIAASIATFAFLMIVNSVYSNWDSVTGGTSSIIGIPTVVGPWVAFAFAAGAILLAYAFKSSRFGLMLRATREDEVAAKASAINVFRVRLAAFVLSAGVVGVGGALWAHFLGVLTADSFYLSLSFITLSMLVVGGLGSLTGAVVGVVVVTIVVEVLRALEGGIALGKATLSLPPGSQEIGLGLVLALIMIFRPSGLTRGREFRLPWLQSRAGVVVSNTAPATGE